MIFTRRKSAEGASKATTDVGGIKPAQARPGHSLALRTSIANEAINRAQSQGCALDTVPRVSAWQKQQPQMLNHRISDRYGEFVAHGKLAGLHEIEQLVPLLTVPRAQPASESWAIANGTDERASELLRRFPPKAWGYHMPLSADIGTLGSVAEHSDSQRVSRLRSNYRLNVILGGLAHLNGGSLAGLSVLDMACTWGAFTIESSLLGASEVHGFDIRGDNIDKARALSGYFGLKPDCFSVSDAYSFDVGKRFDVVLNLGLMYHITKPGELVRRAHELCYQFAVFDSLVLREPFSGFIRGTGEAALTHAATAEGCELHPTYRGLIDLIHLAGFRDVVELAGTPAAEWDGFSKDPYGSGLRRCLVAFK